METNLLTFVEQDGFRTTRRPSTSRGGMVVPSMQQGAMDKWNDLFKESKEDSNNKDEGEGKKEPSE